MSLSSDDLSTIREAIKQELSSQLLSVHDKLDGLAKGVSDIRGEQFAHQATHDRHERWIQRLARKVGLKLEV